MSEVLSDASHTWGQDLALSASGDLLAATGPERTRQRVIRRLLSNPGDLLYSQAYGGGLPAMMGQPVRATAVQAIVARQMRMEAGVAQSPAPTTTVTVDGLGFVSAVITYTDAATGQAQTATVSPAASG